MTSRKPPKDAPEKSGATPDPKPKKAPAKAVAKVVAKVKSKGKAEPKGKVASKAAPKTSAPASAASARPTQKTSAPPKGTAASRRKETRGPTAPALTRKALKRVPTSGISRPSRRRTYRPGGAPTPTLSAGAQESSWILIDAEGLVLGRLASRIAVRLRGKHLPTFTPHMDAGDTIVVINAAKVALTGNKEQGKIYYRHTGFPGGIRSQNAAETREKAPETILILAVSRMLSKGPLQRAQMRRLRVYPGSEHPHEAQNPQVYDFAAENRKNHV